MSLKERVEKITGYRVAYTDDFSDRDYNRIMRQLMLRLVDVEEMFPGEYDYYEDVKEEYLPDFLKCEEDRDYSYSVETSRGGGYKLVVTDWSTDYRRDTVIKIPSFILEENWCNDVESQRISRRINEIDKEINRIEVIMASGTGQIMELNKEKGELELKLQELK
jgi:hypothetical protein